MQACLLDRHLRARAQQVGEPLATVRGQLRLELELGLSGSAPVEQLDRELGIPLGPELLR